MKDNEPEDDVPAPALGSVARPRPSLLSSARGHAVTVMSQRLVLLDLSVFGYLAFEYSFPSSAS
jgi:hypothetical protein